MKKNKLIFSVFFLSVFSFLQAQTIELTGTVTGDDDVENIHVLNKTSLTNTTTDKNGAFAINAKLNDTIVFSALQYQLLVQVVKSDNMSTKILDVTLLPFTNELDEVFVAKQLSGNLSDDVTNSKAKPKINFYDVGIPGYKGKPKTQSERRLQEAGEFKPKMFLGLLTGGIPLNPILNGISGRTKELKQRVKAESDDTLLALLKNRLAASFFEKNPLGEKHRNEFFYFIQEDEKFAETCSKSDLDALDFFQKKLIKFKENLKQKE